MAIRSGAEYRAALRDGREVWQAGRRIDDVTAHPGFTGTVETLADLYDLQRSPEYADAMTVEIDGERSSYSYLVPTTTAELQAKRRNIEIWSEHTFGLMGRFPEFCAELVVGMVDFAHTIEKTDPQRAANLRAYHRHCIANDLCLTHALTDQFYDRAKRASEQRDPDLMLHVVGETPQGPVVRGLRTLATLAPLSDEVLVYPNRPRDADEGDYATAFAIPLATPGLKIICRDLYAEHGDPERSPFTSRFDEVDATLVFDDVVVPWERVFVYRNPALVAALHRASRAWATYSTMVRLIYRLETFLGIAQLLSKWSNRLALPSTQEQMAHFIQDIQVLRACVAASEANATRTPTGMLEPQTLGGYRLYSIQASDRAARTMQDVLTSSLVVTGGTAELSSEIGPLVERYFRSGAPSTRDHLRLLAMANDIVMSPFGMRSQLYERLQSGEPDRMRRNTTAAFKETIQAERVERFIASMDRGPAVAPGR